MRGDEARVVAAFERWLTEAGWTVRTEVDFADVFAQRGEGTPSRRSEGAYGGTGARHRYSVWATAPKDAT